jgi:hypothetical protein
MIGLKIIDEQWKAQVHLLCEHGTVILDMQRVLEPHYQSPARFEQPLVIFTNLIGQGVNTSNKPCSDLNEFLFYLDYTNQDWSA